MRYALAALATVAATPAHAATLVSTYSISGCGGACYEFQSSVPGFDATLGTLNAVTVEADAIARRYYGGFSDGPSTYNLAYTGPYTVLIGGSLLGYGSNSFTFDVTGNSSFTQSGFVGGFLDAVGSGTYVVPVNRLSEFIGPRIGAIGGLNSAPSISSIVQSINGPGNIHDNAGDQVTYFTNLKLTYDYTPAVPEPATWMMLLAGFGMIGWAMRSHRRVERAPEALERGA